MRRIELRVCNEGQAPADSDKIGKKKSAPNHYQKQMKGEKKEFHNKGTLKNFKLGIRFQRKPRARKGRKHSLLEYFQYYLKFKICLRQSMYFA